MWHQKLYTAKVFKTFRPALLKHSTSSLEEVITHKELALVSQTTTRIKNRSKHNKVRIKKEHCRHQKIKIKAVFRWLNNARLSTRPLHKPAITIYRVIKNNISILFCGSRGRRFLNQYTIYFDIFYLKSSLLSVHTAFQILQTRRKCDRCFNVNTSNLHAKEKLFK